MVHGRIATLRKVLCDEYRSRWQVSFVHQYRSVPLSGVYVNACVCTHSNGVSIVELYSAKPQRPAATTGSQ